MLHEVTEKVLLQVIKPGLVAYCPTMDLIALATKDEQVHVFRFNGQRVFGVSNNASDRKVVSLAWKPNGRLLAIALDTGTVLLLDSHTGKTIHQIDCAGHTKSRICCLAWSLNFIDANSTRSRLLEMSKEFSLDDVLSRGMKNLDLDAPLDLPADLASLDIESMLPKLSVLPPSGGKEDDIFASRASIDAVFHSSKKDSNDSADSLIVGFEDGSVHLSIYDFFDIGSFSKAFNKDGLMAVGHSSHPYSTTHGLILADSETAPRNLMFITADLRLITDTGRYLSLLASKATQLQNLLRYVQETATHIYHEFNLSQDLPRKFMRNIEETLQEKENNTFVNAAFHVVATGDCSESMKEWLVDELGDRGHKRWDKAATSGYENVDRFTFQNLLPAIDRFAILISRLRGLSKFQESTSSYGLDTTELDHVLDTVDCLLILSHKIHIKAGAELRQFNAFSRWMKLEIEMQTAERGSQTADDAAAKYGTLDYPPIFDFIKGPMLRSGLYELLNTHPSSDERPLWEMPPDATTMYEQFIEALKANQNQPGDQKLPGLSALVARLDEQCKRVFRRIAETQKRKVRFGNLTSLLKEDIGCFDSRALVKDFAQEEQWNRCWHYIAAASRNQPELHIFRVLLSVTNGVSSLKQVTSALIKFAKGVSVKDVKFVDDDSLLIVAKDSNTSRLISLPYTGEEAEVLEVRWHEVGSQTKPLDLSREEALGPYVVHQFAEGASSTPKNMVVNGRKDRRAVCVVTEDNIHYRVYDIDNPMEDEVDGMEI